MGAMPAAGEVVGLYAYFVVEGNTQTEAMVGFPPLCPYFGRRSLDTEAA